MAASGAWFQSWLDPVLNWLRRHAATVPSHAHLSLSLSHGPLSPLSLFFKQEMELTLVGLQNSGKTTLVNVVAVRAHIRPPASSRPAAVGPAPLTCGCAQTGGFSEDMIPTVGFNMRKVTKGKVTIKLWDLGGQPRFRSMWERYCRGVHAIVYVVDSADPDNIAVSKTELHDLLAKPALERIPVLVLGNKNDLPEALSVDELIDKLNLKALINREVRSPRADPGRRPFSLGPQPRPSA